MRYVRLLPLLFVACLLQAHVGSADIYLDAQAGPYKLFVTVRPPVVIPGVAEVQIRSESAGVREIRAVPVPLGQKGASFAPVADKLKISAQDAQFFTGSLWMMATGSWQIRIAVDGDKGSGSVAVPIPAVALTTKPMDRGLAAVLFCLMWLLIAGFVLLVGASVREAKLPPGIEPDADNRKRARVAMAITFVCVFVAVAVGHRWWKASDEAYRLKIYKPLEMAASVSSTGELALVMNNPAWMNQPSRRNSSAGRPMFTRVMDDLVPDHDHLMHLYAIREPGLDMVYHLHPELKQTGLFKLQLPTMEPGTYRIFADVVHANGFAETMVASMQVPAGLPARTLTGDDAEGKAAPWKASVETTRFRLPDGYVMEWLRPAGVLRARTGLPFRFRLVDAHGQPATDMQFYMGMLGHAAFIKTDETTFAHIHPTGSVSMASYMMAQNDEGNGSMQMASMEMPGMDTTPASLPNEVMFPYGLPNPGQYRIVVQMKHSGVVETGVFDALAVQ